MIFTNSFSRSSANMLSKSNAILSIFNKTITKLLNLADKAQAQAAKKQEEMKKAQEEMEALNKIASDNRAMAKKFEDMIKL